MYEKTVTATIGGTEYDLVYTLAAMLEVTERFGGVEEMAEAFQGPADEDGDTQDIKKQKEHDRKKAGILALKEIPWLIALLANQGIMLKTQDTSPNNPALLTAAKVSLYVKPKNLEALTQKAMEAIAEGSMTEHETGDQERDLVMEEIEKNGEGAAE